MLVKLWNSDLPTTRKVKGKKVIFEIIFTLLLCSEMKKKKKKKKKKVQVLHRKRTGKLGGIRDLL